MLGFLDSIKTDKSYFAFPSKRSFYVTVPCIEDAIANYVVNNVSSAGNIVNDISSLITPLNTDIILANVFPAANATRLATSAKKIDI